MVRWRACSETDDFPRGDVQRGEETARARAFVVVSRALWDPGQRRLGAIECLDLGLLIHAPRGRFA
jgi:hypothetical protein